MGAAEVYGRGGWLAGKLLDSLRDDGSAAEWICVKEKRRICFGRKCGRLCSVNVQDRVGAYACWA